MKTTYIRPIHKLTTFKVFDTNGKKNRLYETACGAEIISTDNGYTMNWHRHWKKIECRDCLDKKHYWLHWRKERHEQVYWRNDA